MLKIILVCRSIKLKIMCNTGKNADREGVLNKAEVASILLDSYGLCDEYEEIKNENNCCVVEGDHYFYKIRKSRKGDCRNKFNFAIWKMSSDILTNMGIEWDFSLSESDEFIYALQRREKLDVPSDGQFEKKDAFLKCSPFRKRLEKKLEFPSLISQLRQFCHFEMVETIILASEKPFDSSDYAHFGGELIQLSDSGWFIAFLDHNGQLMSHVHADVVEIELSYGDFFLGMVEEFDNGMARYDKVIEGSPHWWLYERGSVDYKKIHNDSLEDFVDMMQNNLKFLAGNNKVNISVSD